ncbi:MAG: hypothetical protein ACR2KZ_11475 [Segetibacter sp.]
MADVHDKETRSYNINRIKGKDTNPEMLVRKVFKCLRFSLYDRTRQFSILKDQWAYNKQ